MPEGMNKLQSVKFPASSHVSDVQRSGSSFHFTTHAEHMGSTRLASGVTEKLEIITKV